MSTLDIKCSLCYILIGAKKMFTNWANLNMHSRSKNIRHAIPLILLGIFIGCGSSDVTTDDDATTKNNANNPIQIVATTGMVADLVRNVGGDKVEVNQLFGPTVDPHLHKVQRDDIQAIAAADIVFYSGLMLEGRMGDLFVKYARKKPVVPVTGAIGEENLLEPEDFEGNYDPHVWNDVSAWAKCLPVIEKALAKFSPDDAEYFKKNADLYTAKLTLLHEYGKKSLASVPKEKRTLITSHDAFNYFGRAYDVDVQGVQGLSTESEAGLQRINQLVDYLVEKKIAAVFVESSVPSKNIEALIEGAKSRGHNVRIGGQLYSDAMGEAGTYQGTYIGMLDHNITTVTKALGGSVPERGFKSLASGEANE